MRLFTAQTVLIVGASGGLGAALARAFAAQGASLALVARRPLPESVLTVSTRVTTHQADLTDFASLGQLRDEVLAMHPRIDVLINAAGYDVRKPLSEHSPDDFRRTLEVNLLGAMLLTQTFLPVMQNGVILHLGGFADGRLAFPFYSADAASRAGLRAFTESVNRELALAGRPLVVSFFSPSPADTEAERPFHPLWRQMGTEIVAVEKVAAEVLQAVSQREKVHIMGGFLTRFFAALNAISPRLADGLVMQGYGQKMARFFGDKGHSESAGSSGKSSPWRSLGILLVVLSFVAYGFLFAVPFLPIPASQKLLVSPFLVGLGEVTFWVGGVLLGREVIDRFKHFLNPCNWCQP